MTRILARAAAIEELIRNLMAFELLTVKVWYEM